MHFEWGSSEREKFLDCYGEVQEWSTHRMCGVHLSCEVEICKRGFVGLVFFVCISMLLPRTDYWNYIVVIVDLKKPKQLNNYFGWQFWSCYVFSKRRLLAKQKTIKNNFYLEIDNPYCYKWQHKDTRLKDIRGKYTFSKLIYSVNLTIA